MSYRSKDGDATAGDDYEAVEGKLEFNVGEINQEISVNLIDDSIPEEDEKFYVELSDPKLDPKDQDSGHEVVLGSRSVAEIHISDDDRRCIVLKGISDALVKNVTMNNQFVENDDSGFIKKFIATRSEQGLLQLWS